MKKRRLPNPVITAYGDLHFAAADGQLYINRSFDGGYFLHTRNQDNRFTGITISTADLANIAAALAQLAAADKR